MKLKYFCLFIIGFIIGIGSVSASSIEYNLTINNDYSFHENNIYKIRTNEIDRTGNYDFMTSVVTDQIYFNEDTDVTYTKTRTLSNGVYTVTLKHDYVSSFLVDSRILNECFNTFSFNDEDNELSIRTTSPFYCSSRADSITINIKTDLEVTSNNADSVSNNVYTWTPEDDSFTLRFSASVPVREVDPNAPTDFVEEDEVDSTVSDDVADSNAEDTLDEEENSFSPFTIIIVVGIVLIIGVVVFLILRKKKAGLNKI